MASKLTPQEIGRWRMEKRLKKWYIKPFVWLLDLAFITGSVVVAWWILWFFMPDFVNQAEAKAYAILESQDSAYALSYELCDQARRRLPAKYADFICEGPPSGSRVFLPKGKIDFEKISQETGYTNVELLETVYEHGQICRGRDGFPAEAGEECAYFPWTVAAAIPAGETDTSEWDNVDPRKPGVWGRSLGYNEAYSQFPNSPWTAEACRQGLEAVANNAFVQARWPGIRADQIYTSSGCSIGRGQTLAVHFASGGMLADLENKDVWTSYDAGVEAIYVHLVTRGSCGNGESWFDNRDNPNVDAEELALCSYNPGAYDVEKYQWYWDTLHKTAANLDESYYAQTMASLPAASSPGSCQHDFCLVHPGGIANPTWNFYHNYNGAFGFGDLQHQAQDFSSPYGSGAPFETYAACTGEVTRYELVSTNAGGVVGITCDKRPDITVEYMHLDKETMTGFGLGSKFVAGQEIAIADGSGTASGGVHLHFKQFVGGVVVDPMEWIGNAPPGGTEIVNNSAPQEPVSPIFDGLLDKIPTPSVEELMEMIPPPEDWVPPTLIPSKNSNNAEAGE